ncbi:hypothetical protein DFH09DRAFT_1302625 [Mycena vulgaris]|nr:hypothetical protein DFH09DRAFT_1302625 [Mycena vulgaris]
MGTDAPQQLAPPQLLTEALGFSPQLLLDDIINVANHAVQDGVNGTEDFLAKRLEERAGQPDEEDGTHEVEEGVVAFRTLLEFHTDTPEREQELMDEVEDLRDQLESQRRLKHQLRWENHRQNIELGRARKQYERLAPPHISPKLDRGMRCGNPGIEHTCMLSRLACNRDLQLSLPAREDYDQYGVSYSSSRLFPFSRAIIEFENRLGGGEGEWAVPSKNDTKEYSEASRFCN